LESNRWVNTIMCAHESMVCQRGGAVTKVNSVNCEWIATIDFYSLFYLR